MGDRSSPFVYYPPWDVSACCGVGAEEGREVYLHKEIRDLYHSVYLLRKSPGPPPCGQQQRKEAIQDILSSLRNHLHRWVYPIAALEDTWGAVTGSWSRPKRREDPHEEAIQEVRAAHQRVLEAVQVLESDIVRLSQGLRNVQCACPHSHSGSHLQSWSLDRQPRSPSRPWQKRRVTFQEPEVELDPEEGPYRGALEHSSRIFPENSGRVPLSAQRWETAHPPGRTMACQDSKVGGITHQSLPSRMLKPGWIGGPTKWICLIGGQNSLPSQGWSTHGNLLRKSTSPFQFQQLEARSPWVKGIQHPLPPGVSPGACFSWTNCPIRMCDSSLFSWLWLMSKDYSIGWRGLTHQLIQIFAPWQGVS